MEEKDVVDVVVVGSGLVGSCSALYLTRQGYRVLSVDAASGCASASSTSYANAGRFCPTILSVYPIATPYAAVASAAGASSSGPDAPSSVGLSYSNVKWGSWYLRSCAPDRYRVANGAFRSLAFLASGATRGLIAEMKEENRKRLGIVESNVWVYNSRSELDKGKGKLEESKKSGLGDSLVLSCDECIVKFPYLRNFFSSSSAASASSSSPKEGGCILANDDFTADAAEFSKQVAKLAEEGGAKFMFNTRVVGLEFVIDTKEKRKMVSGVKVQKAGSSEQTLIPVKRVVFAVGPRVDIINESLTKNGIGLPYIPIMNIRGCSLDLTLKKGSGVEGMIGIADHTSGKLNFQVTPFKGGDGAESTQKVRLVGFADALSESESWVKDGNGQASVKCPGDAYRAVLVNRFRQMFPGIEWDSESSPWCGLRPVTPDMLPLTGHVGHGIYTNLGHGAIGWTLSAITSQLLAEEMAISDFGLSSEEQTKRKFIDEKVRKSILAACDPFRFTLFSMPRI